MLKKISLRKISVSALAIVALLMLYLFPENDNTKSYSLANDDIEYVYSNAASVIYLLDSKDYVARTQIDGCNCADQDNIKNTLEGLIIDGKRSGEIPNGFRSIIPVGTEILGLDLQDKVLTVNFSKELLEVNESYEEKMIEAIVFTLTSIDGIDKVIIQVEGEVLEKLPNSNKNLPAVLDKEYGINKVYDLVNMTDVSSYTVYYVSKYNDNSYYVPVTKYTNNKGDKVKIIIDELSSSPVHEANLMSYLSSNASLMDYSLKDDVLKLNFDNYILTDSNKILEEVIYTISLSLEDNYDVTEVDFLVDNNEVYKNVLKS